MDGQEKERKEKKESRGGRIVKEGGSEGGKKKEIEGEKGAMPSIWAPGKGGPAWARWQCGEQGASRSVPCSFPPHCTPAQSESESAPTIKKCKLGQFANFAKIIKYPLTTRYSVHNITYLSQSGHNERRIEAAQPTNRAHGQLTDAKHLRSRF